MTSVYSPVPKFNKDIEKRDLKYGLYTREQFDTLKVYSKDEFDLETMTVGEANSPVTEADFAAVTMAALFTPDLARKSDSEYDPYSKSSLMQVAGLSEQEANQLTDVLDTIHCSFWTTDLFIATPRDNEGDYFKNTTNVGRQMAVDAFNAYKKGNKEPLAQLLAQGIDKGVRELMVDKMAHFLGDQELCICTMVPKMAELMDKDPQLKGIAMEKYGMTEGRFQSAKGLGMLAKAEEKRREASYRLEREAQAGDLHLTA